MANNSYILDFEQENSQMRAVIHNDIIPLLNDILPTLPINFEGDNLEKRVVQMLLTLETL